MFDGAWHGQVSQFSRVLVHVLLVSCSRKHLCLDAACATGVGVRVYSLLTGLPVAFTLTAGADPIRAGRKRADLASKGAGAAGKGGERHGA